MKNIKTFGIIALFAIIVLLMPACDNGSTGSNDDLMVMAMLANSRDWDDNKNPFKGI